MAGVLIDEMNSQKGTTGLLDQALDYFLVANAVYKQIYKIILYMARSGRGTGTQYKNFGRNVGRTNN